MPSNAASIADLRERARRRMPRVFFDYVEGGSLSEQTLAANSADLDRVTLRQRVLIDVRARSMDTTILGQPSSLPFALAPVGASGFFHANGEILAARAAEAAGIPYCLSTMSVASIEDVAGAVGKPFWFQTHLMKDRGFLGALIERAKAAQCSALLLTVDLTTIGQRRRDMRNGMGTPPKLGLKTFLDMAMHPAWALGMAGTRRRSLGNLVGHIPGVDSAAALYAWLGGQYDTPLGWKDIEWVASLWPGKLVLKGICDVEDAIAAAKSGVAAIVVSNHGGRQLDGGPSTISMLPAIVDAVGSSLEVLFDGGIDSGQDIVRALALGARACLVGRAFAYGLGAAGEAGVAEAIGILRREIDITMALTGATSIAAIGRHMLVKR